MDRAGRMMPEERLPLNVPNLSAILQLGEK